MYSAPELLRDGEAGFEADAFALGVIMCQMLYKEFPFKSGEAIRTQEPRLPSPSTSVSRTLNSLIQSKSISLILEFLIKDPKLRGKVGGAARVIAFL